MQKASFYTLKDRLLQYDGLPIKTVRKTSLNLTDRKIIAVRRITYLYNDMSSKV